MCVCVCVGGDIASIPFTLGSFLWGVALVEDSHGENIIAEITDSTECTLLLLLILHNDHLLGGTLAAQFTATVATVMPSCGHTKLGATLQTLWSVNPVGHSHQTVQQGGEQLASGHLMIKDGNSR